MSLSFLFNFCRTSKLLQIYFSNKLNFFCFMETELEELSLRQIAVILRLTYPPGLSLKVCKILMRYYYYFWSHVGSKLLFSCVSYFTEKPRKVSAWQQFILYQSGNLIQKVTLVDIKGPQTFMFNKQREVVKIGIK